MLRRPVLLTLLVACLIPASPAAAKTYFPPKNKVFTGITGGKDFAAFQTQVRKHAAVTQFFITLGDTFDYAARAARENRSRLMLHVGTSRGLGSVERMTPQQIAQGEADTDIYLLAHGIRQAGVPVYLRLMSEMNQGANPYAPMTQTGVSRGPSHTAYWFRQAWRRFTLILRGGPAATISARLGALGLPGLRDATRAQFLTAEQIDRVDDSTVQCERDRDRDGIPDSQDEDSDNNQIADVEEDRNYLDDLDGDGDPDSLDADADANGIADRKERKNFDGDCNLDGIPEVDQLPSAQPQQIIPAGRVAMMWVPQVAGTPNVPALAAHRFWPGGAYVDWVGTDFYSKFPNFRGLDAFYERFGRRGKPFMFGEWAMWDADHPSFVTRFMSWVHRHRSVRMLIYNQGFAAQGPFRIHRYPSARRVLTHKLRHRRFAAYAPEHRPGRP